MNAHQVSTGTVSWPDHCNISENTDSCFRVIFFLFFAFTFLGNSLSAQQIDNTASYRSLPKKSYFRLHFDNDYFTKTDYYYSQGVTLEYVHPVFRKNPVNKLLPGLRNSFRTCGISLSILGYTPTNIFSDSIQKNDRPYAAVNATGIFKTSTDSIRRQRLTSIISIGVIGPSALGSEFQTGIHDFLENHLPHGWENQVHNDIVLNYRLNIEKEILHIKNAFLLNLDAEMQAGTLKNNAGTGFNLMAGHFNDPYVSRPEKKLSYYFFLMTKVNFIAYDASLQGGLFNRKSPYTIKPADLEHITIRADAGIIFNLRKCYFSYSQSFITNEFRQGKFHRWGGVSIGFSI